MVIGRKGGKVRSTRTQTYGPFVNVGFIDVTELHGCEVVIEAGAERVAPTLRGPRRLITKINLSTVEEAGKLGLVFSSPAPAVSASSSADLRPGATTDVVGASELPDCGIMFRIVPPGRTAHRVGSIEPYLRLTNSNPVLLKVTVPAGTIVYHH